MARSEFLFPHLGYNMYSKAKAQNLFKYHWKFVHCPIMCWNSSVWGQHLKGKSAAEAVLGTWGGTRDPGCRLLVTRLGEMVSPSAGTSLQVVAVGGRYASEVI